VKRKSVFSRATAIFVKNQSEETDMEKEGRKEHRRRLERSREHRMLGGVCGGIAKYLDWDVTLVRVGYILLSIFTAFSGVIAYLILWLVMPQAEWGEENGGGYEI